MQSLFKYLLAILLLVGGLWLVLAGNVAFFGVHSEPDFGMRVIGVVLWSVGIVLVALAYRMGKRLEKKGRPKE